MLADIGTQNLQVVAGHSFPIPYIARALVNDSDITVQVMIYVLLPEDKDAEMVTDSFSDLYFYIGQVFDSKVEASPFHEYSDLEISGSGTSRSFELINQTKGVMNYLCDLTKDNYALDRFVDVENSGYYLTDHKSLSQLTFEDFSFTGEEFVAGQKVVVYSHEFTLPAPQKVVGTSDDEIFLKAGELGFDMSLIGFSSVLDLSDVATSSGNEFVAASKTSTSVMDFYNLMCSQVSHEKVFEEGTLSTTPTTIYTFENGNIANGEITQTIDGSFYLLSENMSKFSMIESLIALSDQEILSANNRNEAFSAALDGYRYIIAVYGDTEELLARLDLFKQTYLDKSSTTPMGKWYQKFNRTLTRINRQVARGTRVRPELVITPTVVDNRSFTVSEYLEPQDLSSAYNVNKDYIYVNEGAIQIERIGHFDTEVYGGTVQPDEFENNYTLIENGYFFFDYEKALKTQSVASKVVNLNSYEEYFGKSATNQYFKLSSITTARNNSRDNSIVLSKQSHFLDTVQATYPSFDYMYYLGTDGTYTLAQPSFTYYEQEIYPELMPRNVVFPGNEILNSYRMMAIQFQDIMPSFGPYPDSPRDWDNIKFTITVKDHTKQMLSDIVDPLNKYMTGSFNTYFEEANEFCSYNNIDGFFNKFFIDAMDSKYGGDLPNAPWIKGPTLFNIYSDLLTGQFAAQRQKITNSSIVISNQIAPETGHLEFLQLFKGRVDELLTTYNTLIQQLTLDSNTEDLKFEGNFNMSQEGPPDFLNLTADLYSSLSTETWEEFFSFSKERLNELKAGLRTAWHESNFADAEEFDKIFDVDAAGVMLAKPVIENFIESGAYAGLTDEEASASLEGKLLLAGVSVGVASMIVGAFLTFGVWSAISLGTAVGIAGIGFGAAAASGAAGTLTISTTAGAGAMLIGASYGLYLAAVILAWCAVALIAAAAIAWFISSVRDSNRREDVREIEQLFYNTLASISNEAQVQTANSQSTNKKSLETESLPSSFINIVTELYAEYPVVVYGFYLYLVATYNEIDPDKDVLTADNASILPYDNESIEKMARFIASRSLPSEDDKKYSTEISNLETDIQNASSDESKQSYQEKLDTLHEQYATARAQDEIYYAGL